MRAVRLRHWTVGSRAAGLAFMVLALGAVGCDLDKPDAGPLIGPSSTVLQVALVALPDVVNADGVSQSIVRLQLHDQNGDPAGGRAILFQLLSGDGFMTPSNESTFVGPVQTGLVMATAADGSAVVVYVAGTRYTTATIGVRPYGSDSTNVNDFLRTVEIVQR